MVNVSDFEERIGNGIIATINSTEIKIGSAKFLEIKEENELKQTYVYIKINNQYKGKYTFDNQYRDGLTELFSQLKNKFKLIVLSGDNDGEKENLEKLLPQHTQLVFNQKPEEKLHFIENLQKKGANVLMIGDGLNDAGALAQCNVGISISENINVFSPACDGILDASQFKEIGFFLNYSKKAMHIIYMSFGLSIIYNLIGLSFAITAKLSPIVAAIIMPLSTITIVSFVTIMSNLFAKNKIK
jgi:Cu+-exporting ATPase